MDPRMLTAPGLHASITTTPEGQTLCVVSWDGQAQDGALPNPVWWGSDELGFLTDAERRARTTLAPIFARLAEKAGGRAAPVVAPPTRTIPPLGVRLRAWLARLVAPSPTSAANALSNGGRAHPETVRALIKATARR